MYADPWHQTLTWAVVIVLIAGFIIGGPTYCVMQYQKQTHEQQMKCISVNGTFIFQTGQCIPR